MRLALLPLLLLLLITAPIAVAYTQVSIDATAIDQTYAFEVEPGVLITITFNNLQPNTGVDNLALSFRDNSTTPQEVFILFVKTSGNLVLHVPVAGVTTDQILGSWQTLGSITIRYWSDKLQVLDSNNNILYEVAGNFPALGDIWVHSSNTTASAFTAGTITVSAESDPALIQINTTETLQAVLPLMGTMLGFAIMLAVFTRILRMFESVFK